MKYIKFAIEIYRMCRNTYGFRKIGKVVFVYEGTCRRFPAWVHTLAVVAMVLVFLTGCGDDGDGGHVHEDDFKEASRLTPPGLWSFGGRRGALGKGAWLLDSLTTTQYGLDLLLRIE
jgi:hypothetical protein